MRAYARLALATSLLLSLLAVPARAADAPAGEPVRLPQAEAYQKELRDFMATLAEKDFDHGVTEKLKVPPPNPDLEYQYRNYIFAMIQQPHVGGKRGIGALNCPSSNFLLTTIESPRGIIVPPVWPEAMATFVAWDSPGNVYRNNKALKRRTFVTAAVKLIMLDDFIEHHPALARPDWHGYQLVTMACSYPSFKEILPANVQKSYEVGLIHLGKRIAAMTPKHGECDLEMSAGVGLWYVAHVTGDPAFAKIAEEAARRICTDPQFFHPAGYWVEGRGLDVGFGGMANFWTVWLALGSDYPFAKETLDKVYRLRAHLTLPEPDGTTTGPAAFNTRLGSDAAHDQWDWDGARDPAAAMVTDEALCQFKIPAADKLANAEERRIHTFDEHLYGGLRNAPYMEPDGKRSNRYLENDELRGYPWRWAIFPNGVNYPVEFNPGYDLYRKGSWARIVDLQKKNSPLLLYPVQRKENYIRDFGKAFIAVKRPGFAAILHVGPIGNPSPDEAMSFFDGILGFGGGQLAAFWTPEAGSALLNRRGGMRMDGTKPVNYDKIEEWTTWPIHAVSGKTAQGKVFTSGRIASPAVTSDIQADTADVKVTGDIPKTIISQEGGLTGTLNYTRTFHVDDKGIRVESTLTGDGADSIAELYETLPVYHRELALQPKAGPATIEFMTGDKWAPAAATWAEQVKAVRITRFTGSVVITFDTPRRVKLSAADWTDPFLSKASCRNVLVDLLENKDQSAPVKEAKSVKYTIAPAGK